ncbi:MAG: peroxide stress protein YaaA [Microbacteriaceae bacterium]|nr:peroxide stress protein YaaA [Microbacteriaceae bacterium]
MLLLLPPSETKRDGGADERALDLTALSFPELTAQRRAVLAATRRLARNLSTMAAALKLGPSQRFELIRNRTLGSSPVMPALERYTGVLYDALDVESLDSGARAFASSTVVIHSALFGLLGADDPIPAYRLSHDSRMPGLSLKTTWRVPVSRALAAHDGLVLDLRSEAYAELGPAPGAWFVRVVAADASGRRRALNHFNKKGKGEFVRAVLTAGVAHPDVDSLLTWAAESGTDLRRGAEGELELLVPEIVAARRLNGGATQ